MSGDVTSQRGLQNDVAAGARLEKRMSLCTWICRYRLYFIAAPLALSMSCRPLTRKSQGSSPSPVLCCERYITICNQQSTRLPPSVATAPTSRTAPLFNTSRPLNARLLAAHVSVSSCIPHTRSPSAAPVAPSEFVQGSPGTVSAQALRLAATNHPPLQD